MAGLIPRGGVMREGTRRGAARSARPDSRAIADRGARKAGADGRRNGRGGQPRAAADGQDRSESRTGAAGAAQGRPGNSAEVARLTSLVRPVLAALDLDLEDLRLGTAGRRRLLKVIVDADGGVDLDDIAEASREISAKLDARDAMGEAPYTLEVSSPGVDRPLTEPRHWRRAIGRLVAVPLTGGLPAMAGSAEDHIVQRVASGNAGSMTGRVVRADRDGVTLAADGAELMLPYSDLGPGRVQIEFGRPDAGGGADEEGPDGY
jgi:ribosome maturation factor RimP